MSLQCGIVGLPNVGKSTLFNALTSTQAAEAANYPFSTIDPNVGKVAVPDARLVIEQALQHGMQQVDLRQDCLAGQLPENLSQGHVQGYVDDAQAVHVQHHAEAMRAGLLRQDLGMSWIMMTGQMEGLFVQWRGADRINTALHRQLDCSL